jgi:hypothetical protein
MQCYQLALKPRNAHDNLPGRVKLNAQVPRLLGISAGATPVNIRADKNLYLG